MPSDTPHNDATTSQGEEHPQTDATTAQVEENPQCLRVVRASHSFRQIDGKRYIIANDNLRHTIFRDLCTKAEKNAYFLEHYEVVQDIADDEKRWRGELPAL